MRGHYTCPVLIWAPHFYIGNYWTGVRPPLWGHGVGGWFPKRVDSAVIGRRIKLWLRKKNRDAEREEFLCLTLVLCQVGRVKQQINLQTSAKQKGWKKQMKIYCKLVTVQRNRAKFWNWTQNLQQNNTFSSPVLATLIRLEPALTQHLWIFFVWGKATPLKYQLLTNR